MRQRDALQREILHNGLNDWVPLRAIEGYAKHLGVPEGRARAVILDLLRDLGQTRLVEFGTVNRDGFTLWAEPVAFSLAKIDHDWALGPGARGFRCWTRNTPAGDEMARRLDEFQEVLEGDAL
jgi:hypothetical protein